MDSVLKDREIYVGGSDISAWFGLNSFMNRREFLQEKILGLRDQSGGTVDTNYGDTAEPFIRQLASTHYKTEFAPQVFHKELLGVEFRGNADGESDDNLVLLEIKTSSDTKLKPHYLVQALSYAWMTDKKHELIVIAVHKRPEDALFNEKNLKKTTKFHEFTYDELKKEVEELIGTDFEQAIRKMAATIQTGRAEAKQSSNPATLDVMAYVGTETEYQIYLNYERVKRYKKELEQELTELEEKIINCEAGEYFKITPAQTKATKRFSSAEFRKAHPDLYQEFTLDAETNYKAKIKGF